MPATDRRFTVLLLVVLAIFSRSERARKRRIRRYEVPFAAGGLYLTTDDLRLREQGLFGGKALRPASLQKTMTPFKDDYAAA